MDLGLKDRTVVVTGASGGIGREIARGYAAEGARVVLTYRSTPDEAETLAREINGIALPYDLGDPGSAEALVAGALERTGGIDVLVNNAVRWGDRPPGPDASFEDVPDAEWVEVLRDNVEGALRLSRLVAPGMRERGFGRFVHVSSGVVNEGMIGGEYYAAAKGALHGFSRSAAFSLGRDGDILSNVVMPGFTRTARNEAMAAAVGHHYSARAPIGRLLDAAEVANAVVYLGSAANTGITGQVIAVTGGV
ncbi:SDR family oxidoreductase [Planomonospora sp. ID91781]|uniref:SDR family NAD(P)-dependent oxidoreductase n=1 Tax=Planomonospora sp. ID91781 TaxID=2738135 RepID=UPI0018C3C381|nr:SDR family oxidoreductase [Planomonospora sp. ID91781]MBG0820104.1 SDR family oxidoreductase [Planomonospora sp. ID91781]